jgi:extradiol dioxygenase family protein
MLSCKSILRKITTVQPFHHAFPVYDLEETRRFYKDILGCPQGREAPGEWIDFNLFGHQVVAHKVPIDLVDLHKESRKVISNHVDGHSVPIPHFGCVLTWEQFNDFSRLLKDKQ